MLMPEAVRRGQVYYADLSPVVGSEQGGVRPVLVIQNDLGNRHSPTVIVAAITSKQEKPKIPTHVLIDIDGLKKKSVLLLEQIRTIDKSRLRECLGEIKQEDLDALDKAIAVSLGINKSRVHWLDAAKKDGIESE